MKIAMITFANYTLLIPELTEDLPNKPHILLKATHIRITRLIEL